jgi:hypothetical protein
MLRSQTLYPIELRARGSSSIAGVSSDDRPIQSMVGHIRRTIRRARPLPETQLRQGIQRLVFGRARWVLVRGASLSAHRVPGPHGAGALAQARGRVAAAIALPACLQRRGEPGRRLSGLPDVPVEGIERREVLDTGPGTKAAAITLGADCRASWPMTSTWERRQEAAGITVVGPASSSS